MSIVINAVVVTVCTLLMSVGLSLVISGHQTTKLRKAIEKDDLVIRIHNTSTTLNKATEDLIEIQNELTARIKMVNQLKTEADTSLNLISTTKEQVNSIVNLLSASYKKDNFKSNVTFLFLGAIISKALEFIFQFIIQHL